MSSSANLGGGGVGGGGMEGPNAARLARVVLLGRLGGRGVASISGVL